MKWLALLVLFALISANNSSVKYKILLPIQVFNHGLEFVFNYTQQLHLRHHFNTFLLFHSNISKSVKASHILANSLEQAIVGEFKTPLLVWSMEETVRFRKYLGLNNFALVYIVRIDDPILKVVSESLEGLHSMPILVLFKRKGNVPPSLAELRQFFQWCWMQNIVNVALTFQVPQRSGGSNLEIMVVNIRNEVFSYTPYPNLEVLNLTEAVQEKGVDFMTNEIRDTKGYVFTTPIFKDPPTVFLTPHERHNKFDFKLFITGTAGRIYHEFAHYVNASINIIIRYNISYYSYHKETLLLAANKVIDMGIHPFSGLLPHGNETHGTYPIGQTNACIIVPMVPEIDHSEYLARTLQPAVWLALVIELLCLFVVQCLHSKRLNIGGSILYGFGTLLVQPLDMRDFEQRKPVLQCMHLLVIMANVGVNAVFCGCLTSLMSTTIKGKQIVTVEDFLQSGLLIMTSHFEKEVYFDRNILPAALMGRLFMVNESWVDLHRNNLNTSYAYVATAQEWQKLNLQQQLLRKPLFRIASDKYMCTANYFLRFPIQWDSPFELIWMKYLLTVTDTGLSRVWEDRSISHATKLNFLHFWTAEAPLDIDFDWQYLRVPLLMHTFMMVVALVCFVVELLWSHRSNGPRPH